MAVIHAVAGVVRLTPRICNPASKATTTAWNSTNATPSASGYPAPVDAGDAPDPAGIVIPLRLMTQAGELSFISTTTVFGTPVDVTVSELAIESFFPADAATAEILRSLSDARRQA